MYMEITWKAALYTLIGLFVLATIVMNNTAVARGSTESKIATRGAPASSRRRSMMPAIEV